MNPVEPVREDHPSGLVQYSWATEWHGEKTVVLECYPLGGYKITYPTEVNLDKAVYIAGLILEADKLAWALEQKKKESKVEPYISPLTGEVL